MSSIRHHINIDATPRVVWRALTTAEGLSSWWVDEARVDARVGGRVVLKSEDDAGERVEEVGFFHELRPTRRIEIVWDDSSPSETRGSTVQFQVARDGEETRVSVVHSGGELLKDDEKRASLVKGWRAALSALRGSLE